MSGNTPLVSIGMPLYNEEKYVSQALDSLLTQDFKDFQLVISDNASQDATQRICLDYVGRDSRIRYFRNEFNLGSTENFNRAFRLSSGKYFMWASGHDLWAPCFISRCVAILDADPSVILCYPRSRFINREGREQATKMSYTDTRNMNTLYRFNAVLWRLVCFSAIYGVIRSKALKETRLARKVYGPDDLLLAELALIGSFAHVPELLFYLRDKWEDLGAPKERMRRMFAMMCPSGAPLRLRFPNLRLTYEELIAAVHARVSLTTKAALMACALLGYWRNHLQYLPRSLRQSLRAAVRRSLGVYES